MFGDCSADHADHQIPGHNAHSAECSVAALLRSGSGRARTLTVTRIMPLDAPDLPVHERILRGVLDGFGGCYVRWCGRPGLIDPGSFGPRKRIGHILLGLRRRLRRMR